MCIKVHVVWILILFNSSINSRYKIVLENLHCKSFNFRSFYYFVCNKLILFIKLYQSHSLSYSLWLWCSNWIKRTLVVDSQTLMNKSSLTLTQYFSNFEIERKERILYWERTWVCYVTVFLNFARGFVMIQSKEKWTHWKYIFSVTNKVLNFSYNISSYSSILKLIKLQLKHVAIIIKN